ISIAEITYPTLNNTAHHVDSSSILFFVKTRLPPRPTLFPYTTLFRSSRSAACSACWSAPRRVMAEPLLSIRGLSKRFGGLLASEDRKRTRLNSSHVAISYAVFCLKKKRRILFPMGVGDLVYVFPVV